MKKLFSLLFVVLVFGNTLILSQNKENTTKKFEKATLKDGNLVNLLNKKIKYPSKEALENNCEGTVVLSILINKKGKVKGISILESPDLILLRISVAALNSLKLNFNPTKINDKAVGFEYRLPIHFKLLKNTGIPTNYRVLAEKYIKKNKLDKALKTLNKALANNPYNYQLYKYKSIVESKLGLLKNAREDYVNSVYIYRNVLCFVDISAFSVSKKTVRKVMTTRKVINN